MDGIFERSKPLFGDDGVARLSAARVAVFGVGGVGSYAVEALARAGIGALDLFDGDTVADSNRNRQLIALTSTVGQPKAQVAADRVRDIHPTCQVTPHVLFYLPENADTVDLAVYDFVIDAVDTVSAKLELAVRCKDAGVPLIASMGTGNKWDPTAFRVSDIFATHTCPLARVMRRELTARGITALPVVWSPEKPAVSGVDNDGKRVPASLSFVPPAAGLLLAGYVIQTLLGRKFDGK
ncbi:MAG: tRNA threonylcarbamoyladenosine dehydratase [Ruminococcaceae bacterium]|nr:tRNA threonylcarbamoyladenosine dehydratase [Oscillospiraceae bacterium]